MHRGSFYTEGVGLYRGHVIRRVSGCTGSVGLYGGCRVAQEVSGCTESFGLHGEGVRDYSTLHISCNLVQVHLCWSCTGLVL